jgi:hypothetical protein
VADKLGPFRDPGISERAIAAQYEELPVPVQQVYTRLEYAWLTDAEKAKLIQTITEPEF